MLINLRPLFHVESIKNYFTLYYSSFDDSFVHSKDKKNLILHTPFLYHMMDLNNLQKCIYDVTMDWRTPFITTILYLIYVRHMNSKFKNTIPTKRKIFSPMTFLMASHNLILAIFSMYVFKNTGPFIYNRFKSVDIYSFCSDNDKTIYNHIQYWSWLFYVSKIYEMVDTFIVHLNSRPSIFLQYYHHTGAIFATYLFSIAQTHLSWIFVVLNSFIHSIMYLYYFLSVFGIRLKIKKVITTMQMTQFIVGYIMLGLHFMYGCKFSADKNLFKLQTLTISFNIGYVLVLFVLFKAFFQKEYKKRKILMDQSTSDLSISQNVIAS